MVVFGCWVYCCVLTGIVCVCMVGVIIYLVLFAYIISGFTPFYERMNFYCYLIFYFCANIFITDFPYANDFLRVSDLVV